MLQHPQFDPVALSLGPVQIHWYGLTYLVAFGLFMALAAARARQPWYANAGWSRRDVEDLLFWGVLGVVLGGRIGYALFYKPGQYLANPLEILMVWKGGMSFHGGMLGVIIAMALYARSRGRRWLDVTDLIAPCVPTGLASGRIGNFINGELWGRPADPGLPWAMVFPQSGTDIAAPPVADLPVHAGRAAAVRAAVAVCAAAAGHRPGVGRLPGGLWRAALRGRILPRARQLPGPAGAGPEHGPVAVPADDRRRRGAVGLGRPPAAAAGLNPET
jgi:hypothetical protein